MMHLNNWSKKVWITMEKGKVDIRIKMKSHEKLSRDMDKTMVSYQTLHNELESLVKVHKVASIGALEKMTSKEEVK